MFVFHVAKDEAMLVSNTEQPYRFVQICQQQRLHQATLSKQGLGKCRAKKKCFPFHEEMISSIQASAASKSHHTTSSNICSSFQLVASNN